MNFKIIQPKTSEEFDKYYKLRYEILRMPWNQPESTNKDEWENNSVHLLMLDDNNEAAAAGRLQINSDEEGQVRSMAVRADLQGKGLGTEILKSIEQIAAGKMMSRIVLDAREEAVNFYKKHGYSVVGDSYLLFGSIRHFRMEKHLAASLDSAR